MSAPASLEVALGERTYPIRFSDSGDSLSWVRMLAECAGSYSRIALVADKALDGRVEDLKTASILSSCIRIMDTQGETLKSLERYGDLLDWLAENRLDRKSLLVALGGGVVGDLAGFSAATYLRGIDFVQVPTTLLAMVDSSVGGKTGINLAAGKNLVGAFHQPRGVIVHTPFLKTLPSREFAAGMAEVVKTAMLADAALFEKLESLEVLNPEHPELAQIIRACCAIKAEVVRNDEKEQAGSGGRALLNLGHTFGHAIENASGYGTYLHGEAVAIGLLMAARLSVKLGYLEDSACERVQSLLERYGLPVRLREPLANSVLMNAMTRDKKAVHASLRFVAMRELGRAVTVDNGVSKEWIQELWHEFGASDA